MAINNSILIALVYLLLVFNLAGQSTLPEQNTTGKNLNSKSYSAEISIDPLLLLFKDIDIAVEVYVKPNVSFEIMYSYITKNLSPFDLFSNPVTYHTAGSGIEFYLKYYLVSDHNYDKIYLSPYFRYRNIAGATSNNYISLRNKRFAFGLAGGYKFMLNERLSLELMLGLGYASFNKFTYSRVLNRDPDFGFTNIDVIFRVPLSYRF